MLKYPVNSSGIFNLPLEFNNQKRSVKGTEKLSLVEKGKPGSPCIRKCLALNKEFSEKCLCTGLGSSFLIVNNRTATPNMFMKALKYFGLKERLVLTCSSKTEFAKFI